MGQAGERPMQKKDTRSNTQSGFVKARVRDGGRLATAVAELGGSPLRRASLFRQIIQESTDKWVRLAYHECR
jgi:hypothetical protein